jgi:HlyD family secretion protein
MKFNKKILAISTFLLLVLILIFSLLKNQSIEVKTQVIKRQPFLITVTATSTGTIKAETEANISAQRSGRIERLLFDEGSIVDNKSIIAELESESVYLDLKLAEATLQKAKARLAEMSTAFEAFKADVEANISKNRAVLKEAEKKLKRAEELIKHGYITEAELDLTEKEYQIAKASYESALTGRNQVEAKIYEIKTQEAAVREAEQSYLLQKLNYDYSFIRSPINGIVTSRKVKIGDTVSKGTILGSVVSMDSLYVEGLIDEADIAKVSVGKEANITMDAYFGKIFKGVVYRISPVVTGGKQETRTFEVRIRLKEPSPTIKPGMSAEVEIIVDKQEDALIVPSHAIFERDGKAFLYIVKDLRAKLVQIETGKTSWTYTEILSGLKESDEVIINPDVAGLKDGVKIKRR